MHLSEGLSRHKPAKRAGLESPEHVDGPLMQISMAKQSDLMDTQAKPEELPLSRDQQYGQYGKKFANVGAKLGAKETERGAIRLEQSRCRHIARPNQYR